MAVMDGQVSRADENPDVQPDWTGDLPAHEFAAAVAALPLVSIDWVVTNPAGRLLLGRRINPPARGWWFTLGGRIRKHEALRDAMARIAQHSQWTWRGVAEAAVDQAVHPYVRPYAAWGRERWSGATGLRSA